MFTVEAFLNHPIETLERALQIRKQIDQLNKVLKELFRPTTISLAGLQTDSPKKPGRPRKAKTSVAALEGHEGRNALAAKSGKKKRKLSPEARARIVAAQRARRERGKVAK